MGELALFGAALIMLFVLMVVVLGFLSGSHLSPPFHRHSYGTLKLFEAVCHDNPDVITFTCGTATYDELIADLIAEQRHLSVCVAEHGQTFLEVGARHVVADPTVDEHEGFSPCDPKSLTPSA